MALFDRGNGYKVCARCKHIKALALFSRDRTRGDGLRTSCRVCQRKRHREIYAETKRQHRPRNYVRHLKVNRGTTVEEYDAMLAAQGNGCAICGSAVPGGGRKHFSVDHDHATGRRRGLLCAHCNVSLGHCKDDPAILRAAAAYLESFRRLVVVS